MRALLISVLALVGCVSTDMEMSATSDFGAMRFSEDASARENFAALLADAESQRARMSWNEGPISTQPDRCDRNELSQALRTPWVLLANDAASYADWRRDEAALRERLAILAQLEAAFLEGREPDPRHAPDSETWNVAAFASARAAATEARVQELYARAIRDQLHRIVAFGESAEPFREGLSDTAKARWPYAVSMAHVDCANTAWLRTQINEHGWFDISRYGERADEAAWLIVQHADRTPAFQGEMLIMLEGRAAVGETSPRRVAYLWDRVAVKEGRPQRYGTQMNCQDGEAQPIGGLEDPEQIEARLAAVGMNSYAFYRVMMTRIAGCAGEN